MPQGRKGETMRRCPTRYAVADTLRTSRIEAESRIDAAIEHAEQFALEDGEVVSVSDGGPDYCYEIVRIGNWMTAWKVTS